MALSDNEESNRPEFFNEEEEDSATAQAGNEGTAAAEAIDDDDIGDVSLGELESKVWLVKVPTFLAEKWKRPRKDGVPIGKIRIYDKPDKTGSNIAILLNEADEYKDIPKKYRMQVMHEKVRNMFIFSEGRDPHEIVKPTSSQANKAVPISMTGTVHHECTVTPEYNDEYKNIMRKRVLERHENARKIKTGDLSSFNRSMLGGKASGFDTSKKKLKPDTKTARMERKDLMELLFVGFAKHQYWGFKGLVETTRQPASYLKEVLADIAILNKRGPYVSMYSLKPEFRKNSVEAAAAAAAATAAASADGSTSAYRHAEHADGEHGEDGDMDDIDNMDEDDDFEDV
ncbi:hypothetical protein GGI04_001158 [Coemansia thaxteri]|uniref:Transcription initiation factor IIF subunit beta n=1 Tax=Coemansia thaxteri TaxID=2663907 RepID=A0A9W8BFV2_9FUNG|nr:hypothetical protein H4R26_002779 [Coemansia thaxteri]KAJ2008408.1 hypothetical protein GGI04_001158 [Coemansia thaxteri]KAJ2470908.1 hypothetical protein GGI02_002621 [Coemansia sp. RSA 2322]KAJ2479937.1 hypothetical protein EV174_003875 [Coemansia sp. RSA 2320]